MQKTTCNNWNYFKLTVLVLILLVQSLSISAVKSSVKLQKKPSKKTNLSTEIRKNKNFKHGQQVVKGTLVIKFKSTVTQNSIRANIGIPSIDALNKKFQVQQVEKAFPGLNTNRNTSESELSRIFYFYYNSNEDPLFVASQFQTDPNVEYAEPKYRYPILETPNDSLFLQMSQFGRIEAPAAWDAVKGESGNVVVAIVDGGTDWQHEDLSDNIWNNTDEIPGNGIDDDENGFIDDVRGWNFANNSNDPSGISNTPGNGRHGTHVAGTAAAVTNNEIGVASISWNSILMPINASDPSVDRFITFGYSGIVYAAMNNADIISCSWGGSGVPLNFEQDVINFAHDQGSLVVAAAGNSGFNNDRIPSFPANYKHVLSVGATNKTSDAKAGFSNYGVTVDVFAPGTFITSTIPGNEYSSLSGTSMSTPLVSGLAALIKTQNPEFSVDELREQIRVTSDNIDASNPALADSLGKGRINARGAVTDFNNPAIRIAGLSFTESGGNDVIDAGETVDLTIDFTNFLTSETNVSFNLTSNDTIVEITQSNASTSTFNSEDTLSFSFQFNVSSEAQDGDIMRFFVDINSSNYEDKDFFALVVNPPRFAELNTGNLQTAITTQGNIGWIDFQDASDGAGFVFNGEDYLFEGGLLVGTGLNHVSDCIRGQDGTTQDDDLRPASGEMLNITSPGEFADQEGAILLVDSLADQPIGVEIQQKTFADTSKGYTDFVIFQYEISNPTSSEISNMYVGQFFDWDIQVGNTVNNYARYDDSRRMGFVMNAATDPTQLAASILLTQNAGVSYRSIHNPNELFEDGFTDTEKWNFLSGGIQTRDLDDVDVSTIMAEGPFTIQPGNSIEVAFAMIGANSPAELAANADSAQSFWENPPTAIHLSNDKIPQQVQLFQNYPNPFNPTTEIHYKLPVRQFVEIDIYNLLGEKVRTLISEIVNAGEHKILWNGKNDAGNAVSSGIYFYRLKSKNSIKIKKMTLLR